MILSYSSLVPHGPTLSVLSSLGLRFVPETSLLVLQIAMLYVVRFSYDLL
jgi:hypothetical protein